MKCPLCSSMISKHFLFAKDPENGSKPYELVKCKKCDLVYIKDIPKDLNKHYNINYYSKQESFISNIIKKMSFYSRYLKLPKDVGNILDYGCGNGDFLFEMRTKGFKVYGVESSESGRILSRDKLLKVYDENEFYKLDKKFDIITLWHVFEHVPKPKRLLIKLKESLNDNGSLIICVPNIDAFQFNLFKENTFHLDLPRHVLHYSPDTLKKMLEQNGFIVDGFNHFSSEMAPFGFTQSFLNHMGCKPNYLHNIIKRNVWKKVNIYTKIMTLFGVFIVGPLSIPITYLESFFKKGSCFVVYARNKPRD